MSKIIAVVGATGAQGGGLVRAILADAAGGFRARAITRKAGGDKAEALRALGAEVVPVAPGFDPAAAWEAAVTVRHYDATWALELPRERIKPELRWEADGALAVTGPALHAAQRTRTGVAAALRALLREHDALALPSAQVFPFDVETHWPREIAGRPMPTYHRWMEVVSYASLTGLPVAGVPVGFGPGGLPMGMQLIGRPRGDRALLELTEAYDRATGWVRTEPPLGSRP